MRTRLHAIFLCLISMMAFLSCIHEFPDETTPANIALKLELNIDIDVNAVVNMNTSTKGLSSETHDIRYLVKFFRIVNGNMIKDPVYEHVITVDDINIHEFEVNMEILEGRYRIYVWGDYVEEGTEEDLHYITRDFPSISLNIPESASYKGSLESRDAYVGCTDIEVIRYGQEEQCIEANIEIQRPLAKFVILSSDLEEFVNKVMEATKSMDLNEYSAKVFYQGDESTMYNAPTTFDVFGDKPVATSAGLNFTSRITEKTNPDTGAKEAQLGFDYIFVNGSETHTRVVIVVYDKEGIQVAMSPSIKIPLKRNHVTYVRGRFLMENIKGGVIIEAGFSGPDFNYVIQ